jgi:hypothetical protein
MKLPNGERAIVDIAKLTEYCLNPEHPRGKHKARVFAAALGLTADRADELRSALLEAAVAAEAVVTDQDQYGQRYVVDFTMEGAAGPVLVRSTWITRAGEDFPRLTSCFVA